MMRVRAAPPAEGRAGFLLVACLCGGLSLVGVLITLASPIVDHPVLFASLRGLLTFGLLAVGLAGWARDPGGRYPVLVLIMCCLFAVASLTGVNAPWPFAVGRIVVAGMIVFAANLFLSYPDGRLEDPAARRLVIVMGIATAVLLALTLLLSTAEPVAGPFVRCAGNCPENPLAVIGGLERVGRASSAALALWTVATAVGTAVLLARRMRSATPLERRALDPVLAWTALVAAGFAVYVAVRVFDPRAAFLREIGIALAIIIALIPLALGAALIRGRVFAASALRRTVLGLGERPSAARLRDVLAEAFHDPSLELVFWAPAADAYVDELGRRVELPGPGAARACTRFDRDGRPVAAAIHDRALSEGERPLEAAGGVVLLALENARLEADLRATVSELRVSRARLVAVADEERRRLERDLHDGAQQQLVALGMRLARLRARVEDDPILAAALAEAEAETDAALERIRELGHGIYPQALRYGGLSPALTSAADRIPLPITVHANGLGRVAPEVETAVYFCCLEALQNVAKHASTRTPVDISLTADRRELRFNVADQGPGFDPRSVRHGHGITGMRDRLGAIGGEIDIVSTPGRGAMVTGRVPLARA